MNTTQEISIEERNKLIAEFMCCEKFEFIDDFDKDLSGVRINDSVYPFCSLEYHSSWSWLMPVVEKIEGLYNGDFAIEITLVTCRIYRISELLCQYAYFDITYNGQSKIDSVYNAVIQFIQWYNNQNKK